jgi:hypothetical protein
VKRNKWRRIAQSQDLSRFQHGRSLSRQKPASTLVLPESIPRGPRTGQRQQGEAQSFFTLLKDSFRASRFTDCARAGTPNPVSGKQPNHSRERRAVAGRVRGKESTAGGR